MTDARVGMNKSTLIKPELFSSAHPYIYTGLSLCQHYNSLSRHVIHVKFILQNINQPPT